MERDDLSRLEWLKHAQEEAMDLAVYLQKLIQMEEEPDTDITLADVKEQIHSLAKEETRYPLFIYRVREEYGEYVNEFSIDDGYLIDTIYVSFTDGSTIGYPFISPWKKE